MVDLFSDGGGVFGVVAVEGGSFGMASMVNGAGEVEIPLVIEVEEGSIEALVMEGLVVWNFSHRMLGVGAGGEDEKWEKEGFHET